MKRTYPEHELQKSCVKWFDLSYSELKHLFFHIPNERKQSPIAGARLKAIGQRAGVADMFLAIPYMIYSEESETSETCAGMFIEFKAPDKAPRQTPEQKNFQIAVEHQGYLYVLINSFDRFKEVIEQYLKH